MVDIQELTFSPNCLMVPNQKCTTNPSTEYLKNILALVPPQSFHKISFNGLEM
jgi:hypothetical protein